MCESYISTMVKEVRIVMDDEEHKIINEAKKEKSYKEWMLEKAEETN